MLMILLLVGHSLHAIQVLKNFLHKTFRIKDLGKLKYFLSLKVARSHAGINVCQRKYCLNSCLGYKPALTLPWILVMRSMTLIR